MACGGHHDHKEHDHMACDGHHEVRHY
jgi:hypothetical protein